MVNKILRCQDLAEASRRHLSQTRERNQHLHSFLKYVERQGRPILFGGAVRDIWIQGSYAQPRDYDFVIEGMDSAALENVLRKTRCAYRGNKFGGFQVTLEGLSVDVWSLETTWAFRQQGLRADTSNLVRSVFLNIDAVAFDVVGGEILEDGFGDAFSTRELDIVLHDNPFPDLCVLKTVVAQQTYGFKLSRRLCQYVTSWYKTQENPMRTLSVGEHKRYRTSVLDQRALSDSLGL